MSDRRSSGGRGGGHTGRGRRGGRGRGSGRGSESRQRDQVKREASYQPPHDQSRQHQLSDRRSSGVRGDEYQERRPGGKGRGSDEPLRSAGARPESGEGAGVREHKYPQRSRTRQQSSYQHRYDHPPPDPPFQPAETTYSPPEQHRTRLGQSSVGQERYLEKPTSTSTSQDRPRPVHGPTKEDVKRETTTTQKAQMRPTLEEAEKKPRSEPPVQPSVSAGAVTGGSQGIVPPSTREDASKTVAIPSRPDYGTTGRRIQLKANHFPLMVKGGFIYHYDVEITPSVTNRSVNRQVVRWLEEKHRKELEGCKLAFDGRKNLYTVKHLPKLLQLTAKGTLEGEDREREFQVKIKYVAPVSLDVLNELHKLTSRDLGDMQTAVQAIDIVVSQIPSMRFASVGRSYFPADSRGGFSLGEGKELRYGYYQSVRPTMWGMVINVDTSATAFYEEKPVLEFLKELLQARDQARDIPRSLTDSERVNFAKEIKGLRIEVTHLSYPRKYRVVGVTRQSAAEQTFPMEDGKHSSVKDYFEETYKHRLEYPHLPCLHVGSKQKHVYIPMEVAKILSQHCDKKLKPYQTAQVVRKTARPAFERQADIERKVQRAGYDYDEYLKEFGVKVNKNMAELTGRVLDPPLLQSQGRSSPIVPLDGVWRMESGAEFYKGADVQYWGIVTLTYVREDPLRKFVRELTSSAKTVGLTMAKDPCAVYSFRRRDNLKDVFQGMRDKQPELKLIIAILDRKGGDVGYSEVKRVGDNQVGICTQCVLADNAMKANPATMANICLKINAKLGGINTIIEQGLRPAVFREPVIIMGADVTHPAPGEKSKPSIAAVVASMDYSASKYRAVNKILRHRQEVLEVGQLSDLVQQLLRQFRISTGLKPRRIIFYRDGVSEGQFKEVIKNEVAAIQQACIALEEGYEPGITFLVVQKRHHTRLFCAERRDQKGKSGNVPAGTIVDQGITHPTEFDFYLCSHQGIQGTSRPCHYHVLWDDNAFSADDLQKLSYQLCHSYARCNRSVSYPAPAYYAHHVAFRARYHLQDWEDKSGNGSADSSSVATSGSSATGSLTDKQVAVTVHKKVQEKMYFV